MITLEYLKVLAVGIRTFEQLILRARKVITTLGYPQTPQLLAPTAIKTQPIP